MAGTTSDLWRVDSGTLPGCPIGSIVWFVNDQSFAQVFRQGVGAVGTLTRPATTQTASPDGAMITLVNAAEGWTANLTRFSGGAPPAAAPAPAPTQVADGWTRTPAQRARIELEARPDIVIRQYRGRPTEANLAYQEDATQMAAAGWLPIATSYEKEPVGWARLFLIGWLAFLFRPPGTLVVTYQHRSDG